MTKPFISSSFNSIQLKILKLYNIYTYSDLTFIDKYRVFCLIRSFEGELNKLNDMYFKLFGDIEKYVQYYEYKFLNSNDSEDD